MTKIKTKDEFIVDARVVHGDKYDYSLVEYKGNKVKVDVICKKHGVFPVKPNAHVSSKTECPFCAREKCYYTTEKIILAFQEKHGDKFDYKDVVFTGIHEKVKVWCRECSRPFFVRCSNHLHNGTECPKCYQKGERNPVWNPDRELIELRQKIHEKVKGLISHTLAGQHKEGRRSHQILGWTRAELLGHIVKCQEWEQCRGTKWHVDHIFPVAAFVRHGITNPRIINHLNNLRPMLPALNIQKKDKYNEQDFLEWLKQFSDTELGMTYDEVISSCPRGGHKVKVGTTSIYVGVTKQKSKKDWYAKIRFNGTMHYLGYFKNEEDAAKHYDYFCLKYYGHQPNFPNFDYSQFIPKPTKKYGLTKAEGVDKLP